MSGNLSTGVSAIGWILSETRLTLPPRPKASELAALYARRALVVDIRPVGSGNGTATCRARS